MSSAQQQRSETLVENSLLQEPADEAMKLVAPGNGKLSQEPTALYNPDTPGTLLPDLKRIGELIFSDLLTEPARNRLRTGEPCDLYLRLVEQLIHFPWELCYDGHDFLATKFRVGRQIITDYAVPVTTATGTLTQPFKVLLIADPTETLPQAKIGAQQLLSLLKGVEGIELTRFQSMASGHSLGMALQQARHAALEEYGGQSLTWASYSNHWPMVGKCVFPGPYSIESKRSSNFLTKT